MDYSMPGSSVLHYFPRVCPNLCPLSQWCYLTISSSAAPFSFCLRSLSYSNQQFPFFASAFSLSKAFPGSCPRSIPNNFWFGTAQFKSIFGSNKLFKNFTVPQFSSVQSLSRVWLFATPWIAACLWLSLSFNSGHLKLVTFFPLNISCLVGSNDQRQVRAESALLYNSPLEYVENKVSFTMILPCV